MTVFIVPALALFVAVALWKALRIGSTKSPARKTGAALGFVVLLGAIYLIGFLALWSWGSGS